MAQSMFIKIVGDASSYEKALHSAARSTQTFTRQAERATRGVAAGSGLFRGLGRSIAFASGGFLAFSSGTEFVRKSVDAAREAAVAQRSLAAQMRASGQSFDQNRAQIEQLATSYERLGFNNEQVIESLTVLERGTGRIDQAMRLEGLTADIARAKNIDLSAAANTVAKVFGHQETALRRAVPGLSKTAHGWDLIRQAQQRMAGQAAAGTTASERFNATLHNMQAILGTALLPVLNRTLNRLSRWMDQMNRSGRMAKDVNEFANAISALATAIGVLNKAVGGFLKGQNFMEKQLGRLGFMVGGIWDQVRGFSSAASNAIDAWKQLLGIRGGPHVRAPRGPKGMTPAEIVAASREAVTPAPDATAPARKGVSAALRNQWFDARIQRMLTRAQYDTLRQQLQIYKQVAAIITARIAVTKDITRKLNLEDQLLSVQYQRRQIQQQIRQQALDAARARRERLQAARQVAADRLAAAQMRLLGLDPSGQPLTAGIHALRRRLASIREAIAGTALDTPRREGLLARIQKLLLGRHLRSDVRSAIAQIFDDIRSEINNQAAKVDVTKFQKTSGQAFLASLGLNLSPAQRRRFLIQWATIGPGGAVPASTGQFTGAGAGVYVAGDVHVHGVQNTKQLENELTKRRKQRAHSRRGTR